MRDAITNNDKPYSHDGYDTTHLVRFRHLDDCLFFFFFLARDILLLPTKGRGFLGLARQFVIFFFFPPMSPSHSIILGIPAIDCISYTSYTRASGTSL